MDDSYQVNTQSSDLNPPERLLSQISVSGLENYSSGKEMHSLLFHMLAGLLFLLFHVP